MRAECQFRLPIATVRRSAAARGAGEIAPIIRPTGFSRNLCIPGSGFAWSADEKDAREIGGADRLRPRRRISFWLFVKPAPTSGVSYVGNAINQEDHRCLHLFHPHKAHRRVTNDEIAAASADYSHTIAGYTVLGKMGSCTHRHPDSRR